MPSIFLYIIKLCVALAAVYFFYQLVLRRLTFYNWNRWYLLGYTILAFFISFINITPILESNEWSGIRIINWVPVINEDRTLQNMPDSNGGFTLSSGNIMLMILISGVLFLFVRLIIQFVSFNRMKKKATPFTENGLTIYEVNENIIPFSFGNSIFINKQLHNEEELSEIIKHEIIHVKQKHSVDIIWGELLCLLNWYNPFAWLLKRSIRQNLEFIADNKVIQNGIDKKEYQYLLLKVIGHSQYSIATQFNFSSLKKRIAMMNKSKSARMNLARFLFVLPLIAVLLLAFRNSGKDFTVVKPIENKNSFTVRPIQVSSESSKSIKTSDTTPITNRDRLKRLSDNFEITEKKATIHLKNGITEVYDLANPEERKEFEKNYGKIISLPISSEVPVAVTTVINSNSNLNVVTPVTETAIGIGTGHGKGIGNGSGLGIGIEKAVIEPVTVITADGAIVSTESQVVKGIIPSKAIVTTSDLPKAVRGTTVITPMNPVVTGEGVTIVDDDGNTTMGEEEVLLTITKNTKREQLEDFKKQLKQKGVELNYADIEYDNKGILTYISGTMDSKDGKSNFVADKFEKLIISIVTNGNKTYFKIRLSNNKTLS